MEVYILITFLWIVGFLYACGEHQAAREVINERGSDTDKAIYNQAVWLQYTILFLFWPHYLGYNIKN